MPGEDQVANADCIVSQIARIPMGRQPAVSGLRRLTAVAIGVDQAFHASNAAVLSTWAYSRVYCKHN